MKKSLLILLLSLCMMMQILPVYGAETAETVPSKSTEDIVINGELMLDENGNRVENIEDAVNLPEDYYSSQEYLDSLNKPKDVVSSFPDVPTDHSNFAAIEDMKKRNLMIGYEDGKFLPDGIVTRAEYTKILVEKNGGIADVPDGVKTGFSDVDTNPPHWAYKYIYKGVQKGYIAGMGDGTFAPGATITYEQAMKLTVCFIGKETAAKAKVTTLVPLWPNAYVLTGEQLGLNTNTILSMGQLVSRAYTAQIIFNSIKVFTPGQNVIVPGSTGGSTGGGSSGGGNSGGGGSFTDDTKRYTGIVVSTQGISIDPSVEAVSSESPFVVLKTADTANPYVTLRNPRNGSANMYDGFIGQEVSAKCFYNDYSQWEISEFKATDSNTIIDVKAEEIDRAGSNTTQLVYRPDGIRYDKTIKLPSNLDDMIVVYNGVPIDYKHPRYDHDPNNHTGYIQLSDIMPEYGEVKFINHDKNAVDVAIVTAYDTLIVKSAVSSSTGKVIDKYDSTKTYTLDNEKLYQELSARYSGFRTLNEGEVRVTFSTKGSTNETTIRNITKDSVLTVYASKDMTHVKVIKCTDVAGGTGSSGAKVQSSYDAGTSTVNIAGTEYDISDYFKNVVASSPEFDDVASAFPVGSKVVAYLNSFGHIVDVEVKPPEYIYGYLVDVDYQSTSSQTNSYFNMRIITKNNVSGGEEAQTYTLEGGKLTLDGTKYSHANSGYDTIDTLLRENAFIINNGNGTTISAKPESVTRTALYAQPVRIEIANSSTRTIRSMLTIQPYQWYTEDAGPFTCTSSGQLKRENVTVRIPTTVTIFSVPDNRYDYENYSVYTGYSTAIKNYSTHNAEIYRESTETGYTNNCVVLYDEGLTANPTPASPIAIVKEIKPYSLPSGDATYQLTVYEPTAVPTSTLSTKPYTLEESSELIAVNTSQQIEVGDAIVFGKTGDGKYIKNIHHVLDISNRNVYGFNVKYNQYGAPYTTETNPYYWYRFGVITQLNPDEEYLMIDVGEAEDIQVDKVTALCKNGKPVFFTVKNNKPEVLQGVIKEGDNAGDNLFKEIAQEGDLVLVFTSSTSATIKTFYLIPKFDIDSLYPDLAPTYSDITFNVSPADAVVTIEGYPAQTAVGGVTTFTGIPNGTYHYTVSKTGYISETGSLRVRRNEPSYTKDVPELVAQQGTVRFVVTPETATVEFAGQTQTGVEDQPMIQFGVALGTHTYTVSAPGYRPATGSVEVTGGEVRVPITLERLTASITFNVPEGATVEFNGQSLTADSTGAVVFTGVETGEKTYTVTKAGYITQTDNYTVGETDDIIVVSLEPAHNIEVLIDTFGGEVMEGGTITIDGKDIDIVNGSATVTEIAAGSYEYSIAATGYVTITGNITVSDGANEINETIYRNVETVIINVSQADATVTVGGVPYTIDGEGNVLIENVPENTAYEVTLDGYETVSGTIEHSDNGSTIVCMLVPTTPEPSEPGEPTEP